jgi:hypothetical protein
MIIMERTQSFISEDDCGVIDMEADGGFVDKVVVTDSRKKE